MNDSELVKKIIQSEINGAAAGDDLFKLMEASRHKKPETVIGYVRKSKLFENHEGEKFL